MDTIFAVSSGALPAAIAVIRLSGPAALSAACALAGRLPEPRRAGLRTLRHPADGRLLDRALVLVFPGPNSATGEDLVELHAHGGRASVRAIEDALGIMPGLRNAEPGEFTRRALANGRIDLTEAEGLGDLLAAETEQQRRAAMALYDGSLRRLIEDWGQQLVRIAARVEAQLDFSDEDDLAENDEGIAQAIGDLAEVIAQLVANPPAERLKDGLRVVIAGPPNSGKSTLINALTGRDAAIVSAIPGTTRDRIEAPVVKNGIAYVVIDTAGLRTDSDDVIERVGIDRAADAIRAADILLWLGDEPPQTDGALWAHPRADVAGREAIPAGRDLAISAMSGYGIDTLWAEIDARARTVLPTPDMIALNRRQRGLLSECSEALSDASHEADLLIVAEGLRLAMNRLHQVTGKADVEAMLDALFGQFCIGK